MKEPQVLPFAESEIVFSPARTFDASSYPSGGAGMVGTAGDYLVFLEALRKGGDGILKSATAAAMTANQTADLPLPLPGGTWGVFDHKNGNRSTPGDLGRPGERVVLWLRCGRCRVRWTVRKPSGQNRDGTGSLLVFKWVVAQNVAAWFGRMR